ncbi:MAG TPA: cation diffusion facilitator family transporter [Pseudolabrys sp.]|nr:cation diffusion facilitator family transporter [Pseudolabrys sp.]
MAHAHHHTHTHIPDRRNFGRNFAIATVLNAALVVAQVVYGFLANSLALLADAGHNFGDVIGLVLAWLAFVFASWRPSDRYTYRMQGASILAALANAVLLLVATGAIGWEALRRFAEPVEVATTPVMIMAAIGVAVNGVSALFLRHGRKSDLNVNGAFVHMMADAGVSVAVLAAAFGIYLTGWQWLDPVAGLLIAAVILGGTWSLLRESLRLSLNAAPSTVDPAAVQDWLETRPEVRGVHDLHIWAMSTTATAMSCHLVMASHPGNAFLHELADELEHRFNIGHPTIQIELAGVGKCPVEHDHAA